MSSTRGQHYWANKLVEAQLLVLQQSQARNRPWDRARLGRIRQHATGAPLRFWDSPDQATLLQGVRGEQGSEDHFVGRGARVRPSGTPGGEIERAVLALPDRLVRGPAVHHRLVATCFVMISSRTVLLT
jgi:hypothetical protein